MQLLESQLHWLLIGKSERCEYILVNLALHLNGLLERWDFIKTFTQIDVAIQNTLAQLIIRNHNSSNTTSSSNKKTGTKIYQEPFIFRLWPNALHVFLWILRSSYNNPNGVGAIEEEWPNDCVSSLGLKQQLSQTQ